MRKNSMAKVNVRVDCSPFGFGLHTSLAGIEDMMKRLLGIPVETTSLIASLEHISWNHNSFVSCCRKIVFVCTSLVSDWWTAILKWLLNSGGLLSKLALGNYFLIVSSPGSLLHWFVYDSPSRSPICTLTSSHKAILSVCRVCRQ